MKIYVTFRYKLCFIIALEVTSHVFDVLILHVTFTVCRNYHGYMHIHVLFTAITDRPYALTLHLHNNDAMLGVNTCRAPAHVLCWKSVSSQSVRGPGGMAFQGLARWLHACARDSASFDPQHAGASFCDVICIRSIDVCVCVFTTVTNGYMLVC